MPTLDLGATVQTTTVHELPLFSSYGPLTSSDEFLMWLAAFNKTVKIPASSLYDFMQGVGAGTFEPVIIGDKYIYTVPEIESGGTTASIPALAGQNFFLQNENGYPYTTDEFNILNAGGFEILKPGETLVEGMRFTLTLYSLQGGSSVDTNTTKPLLTGSVSISSNTTYDIVNHVNKLLQLRGGSTQITLTLPLVDDIPDNTIIIIEAMINNTVEQKIQTQSGQLIYLNNTSKTAVYMRAGESLWLYRADDGYYVINSDFSRVYRELGSKPQASYEIGLNELLCNGQLLSRTAYPRLWEKVQTLGFSVVSDTTWNTASATVNGREVERPYRGCFSTGDGSTTFRIPDLMDMTLKGILSDSGSDPDRLLNKAGGFQKWQMGEYTDVQGDHGDDDTLDTYNNGPYKFKTKVINEGKTVLVDNVGVLWTIKC